MHRGNYRLENELDELAKLYFKEFPALDSKVKRSPKLRAKNENIPINRELKQIKSDYISSDNISETETWHFENTLKTSLGGRRICFDNKYRQNVNARYKQHRKIRNLRPKHEEWNMEFEGNWEMDEDLVAEFLKSQNQIEYDYNKSNNIGCFKQHETVVEDLFSFLPTFIFEDPLLKGFHNKNKDEGYITSDSSFYTISQDDEFNNESLPEIDTDCVSLNNDNMLLLLRSKLDENVRKIWNNDPNDSKTELRSNNFIHRGTNLQESIWSETIDMGFNKFASLINSKSSNIEDKNIVKYEAKISQSENLPNMNLKNTTDLPNSQKSEKLSTQSSSATDKSEITLVNHSESSSFVRVKSSKKTRKKPDNFTSKAAQISSSQKSNENLLTSDATHFRPIKETFIDGHTFQISYTPKHLNFERSESGSLYLNGVNYFEVNDDTNNGNNDVLLLKFRKRQNEKASQTQAFQDTSLRNGENCKRDDIIVTDMSLENVVGILRKDSFDDKLGHHWCNSSYFQHLPARNLSSPKLTSNNILDNNYNIWSNNYNIWSNNNENSKDTRCTSCHKFNSNSDIMKAELRTEGEELMYDILNYDVNTLYNKEEDESDDYEDSDNNNNIYLNMIIPITTIFCMNTKVLSSMLLDQILLNSSGKENSLPQSNKIDTIITEADKCPRMFKKKLFQFKLDNEKRFIRKRHLGICRK